MNHIVHVGFVIIVAGDILIEMFTFFVTWYVDMPSFL